MKLKQWRLTRDLTLAEMASALVIESARTYQRYEEGENRPDAPLVERIRSHTSGEVTAEDIHAQRLEWLAVHRPDAFATRPAMQCAE